MTITLGLHHRFNQVINLKELLLLKFLLSPRFGPLKWLVPRENSICHTFSACFSAVLWWVFANNIHVDIVCVISVFSWRRDLNWTCNVCNYLFGIIDRVFWD